jgi:hypothetical protein
MQKTLKGWKDPEKWYTLLYKIQIEWCKTYVKSKWLKILHIKAMGWIGAGNGRIIKMKETSFLTFN